jgi:hypothetical protein
MSYEDAFATGAHEAKNELRDGDSTASIRTGTRVLITDGALVAAPVSAVPVLRAKTAMTVATSVDVPDGRRSRERRDCFPVRDGVEAERVS